MVRWYEGLVRWRNSHDRWPLRDRATRPDHRQPLPLRLDWSDRPVSDLDAVIGQVGKNAACSWREAVALSIRMDRQRVPMVASETLEDRTRPAQEGSASIASRLRLHQWPYWSQRHNGAPAHEMMPTLARLGRR